MLRGFIGPLGDDIPSIFPIVAGILLFLGTLIYANGALQDRNADLDLREVGLQLSYEALKNGFVSKDSFEKTCTESLVPTGDKSGVFFVVVLKDCDDRDSEDPFKGDAVCHGSAVNVGGDRKPNPLPAGFVSLAYPVATNCDGSNIGNGLLNVITWHN